MRTKINNTVNRKLIILIFAVFITAFPVSLFSATLTVCSSACSYTTLALAIAGAASGDTIQLQQNITEDITLDSFSKTLTITSDGTRRTWTNSSARNLYFTNTGGYNITIQNLDMVNTGGSETVLMNQAGSLYFRNVKISNTTGSGKLVYMQNGGNMYFYQSELVGNALTPVGIQIASGVNYPSGVYAENTIFREIGNGNAVQCDQNSGSNMMYIYNCTFEGNKTAYNSLSAGLIKNSLFINNTDDVSVSGSGALTNFTYCGFSQQTTFSGTTGNIFGLTPVNVVVNLSGHDLHLVCSGNSVVDAGTDMSAFYTVDKDGVTRPQGPAYDMGAYECPVLNLSKSASSTFAYLGDTITYCLTYTNSSSSDRDTNIWDTVPANTLYLGCSGGCDLVGGTIVHWFLTVGAGYSGTLCFWVKVTGYPFINGESGFFADADLRKLQASGSTHSILALDGWKFWMAGADGYVKKNREER